MLNLVLVLVPNLPSVDSTFLFKFQGEGGKLHPRVGLPRAE